MGFRGGWGEKSWDVGLPRTCVAPRGQGEGVPGRGLLGVSLSHFLSSVSLTSCVSRCLSGSLAAPFLSSVSLHLLPTGLDAEQGSSGPCGQRMGCRELLGLQGLWGPQPPALLLLAHQVLPTVAFREGGDVVATAACLPRSWAGEERPGALSPGHPGPSCHLCELSSTLDASFLARDRAGSRCCWGCKGLGSSFHLSRGQGTVGSPVRAP